MILNVFGKEIEVLKDGSQWKTFYLGSDGKKRIARDIVIPNNLPENEVVGYVADLCHEWATAKYNEVVVVQK